MPDTRLTTAEQLAYQQIVQHETTDTGRRILDRWAQPDDAHPHAERALTETLKLLWRT